MKPRLLSTPCAGSRNAFYLLCTCYPLNSGVPRWLIIILPSRHQDYTETPLKALLCALVAGQAAAKESFLQDAIAKAGGNEAKGRQLAAAFGSSSQVRAKCLAALCLPLPLHTV